MTFKVVAHSNFLWYDN